MIIDYELRYAVVAPLETELGHEDLNNIESDLRLGCKQDFITTKTAASVYGKLGE